MSDPQALHPCPCCGFLVFREAPGSYDVCSVCGWEDDHVQLRYPLAGGANAPLVAAQRVFLDGLTEARLVELAASGKTRCHDWRPLRPSDARPEQSWPRTGLEYFHAAGQNSPEYYWRLNP